MTTHEVEPWVPCCDEMSRALESGFVCFLEATITDLSLSSSEAAARETHVLGFDSEKAEKALAPSIDYCPWCSEECGDDQEIHAAAVLREAAAGVDASAN